MQPARNYGFSLLIFFTKKWILGGMHVQSRFSCDKIYVYARANGQLWRVTCRRCLFCCQESSASWYLILPFSSSSLACWSCWFSCWFSACVKKKISQIPKRSNEDNPFWGTNSTLAVVICQQWHKCIRAMSARHAHARSVSTTTHIRSRYTSHDSEANKQAM